MGEPGIVINLNSCRTFVVAWGIGVIMTATVFSLISLSNEKQTLQATASAELFHVSGKFNDLTGSYKDMNRKVLDIQLGISELRGHMKNDSTTVVGVPLVPTLPRCTRNPFISFITPEKFDQFERWALAQRLLTPSLVRELEGQSRYSWEKFVPVIPGSCDGHVTRIGNPGDGGKLICGLEQMDDNGCVVFSLGSNGDWSFENHLLATKAGCRTVTFDCTGDWQPPAEIRARATIRKQCFGVQNTETGPFSPRRNIATMIQENAVKQLHFLKMDIENGEWGYFADMFANTRLENSAHLPDQMVVEIHMFSHDFYGVTTNIQMVANMVDGMYDLGYRIVAREKNIFAGECYELTFVRFRC